MLVDSVFVVTAGVLLFSRLLGTDAMLRNAAETENELPADEDEGAAVVASSTGDVGRSRATIDSTVVGMTAAIPSVAVVVEGMGGDFAR